MNNLLNWDKESLPSFYVDNIGGEEITVIDLRDLWRALEVKRQFGNWVESALSEFTRGVDYEVFNADVKNPQGGRPAVEYSVTLDCAKSIALMSKTSKGRDYRQYLIDYEKRGKKSASLPVSALDQIKMLAGATLQELTALREDLSMLKQQVTLIEQNGATKGGTHYTKIPLGCTIKTHAIRDIRSRYGLAFAVTDAIFTAYADELQTRDTVDNPTSGIPGGETCRLYNKTTITAVVKRVLAESVKSGSMYRHQDLPSRFHILGKEVAPALPDSTASGKRKAITFDQVKSIPRGYSDARQRESDLR